MKNPRIKLSFMTASDAKLESEGQFIVTSMTDNTNFPSPTPGLAAVGTALTEYSVAKAEAAGRDRTKVAIKNSKKLALQLLLKTLANYVALTANGDEAMLVSSGFQLVREAQTTPPLEAPENFNVTGGFNQGEIVTKVDRVLNARSYLHECTEDPIVENSDWDSRATTGRDFTFTGLQPGKKYWFRVAVIGVRDQIIYSPNMSRIAI